LKNLIQVQVVTGIFEIGRNSIDGRGLDFYLQNLAKLLEIYPSAIVFHNLSDDKLSHFEQKFTNCKLLFIEIEELPLSKFKKEISTINSKMIKNHKSKDLIYRSTEYGILINSKPLFLLNAKDYHDCDFSMWIDAGISRFYPNAKVPKIVVNENFIPSNYIGIFDIDVKSLLRNFKPFKSPKSWIDYGTSTRVISGGAFLLRTDSLLLFHDFFMKNLLSNLKLGLWDTEQINLLKIMGNLKVLFLTVGSNIPISLLQNLTFKKTNRIRTLLRSIVFFRIL
jgi:hypothetical protein